MTAPTIVHEAVNANSSTLALSVTSGNVFIVFVSLGVDQAALLPSDSQGNTFTRQYSVYFGPAGFGVALYSATASSTGSNTITSPSGSAAMAAADLANVGSGVLDGAAVSRRDNGTDSTTNMTTTSFTDDLLFCFLSNFPTITIGSPASGFANEAGMTATSVGNSQLSTATRSVTATGTYSAGWGSMTNGSGRTFFMLAAAIKGVTSASSRPVKMAGEWGGYAGGSGGFAGRSRHGLHIPSRMGDQRMVA